MKRTEAREIAFMLLYMGTINTDSAAERVEEFFEEEHYESLKSFDPEIFKNPDEKNLKYIKELLLSAYENREELDERINKYLKNWRSDRLSKTSLALLRMSMAEILYLGTPVGASINEAVEIAKKYEENTETVALINGVLGSFSKEISAKDEEEK